MRNLLNTVFERFRTRCLKDYAQGEHAGILLGYPC